MNLVTIALPQKENGQSVDKNSIITEKIATVNLLFKEFTDRISDTELLEKEDVVDIRYIIESFMDDLSNRRDAEVPLFEHFYEEDEDEEIIFFN
ncbi:MAG: hypothetical protein WCR42_12670 [bacterium]